MRNSIVLSIVCCLITVLCKLCLSTQLMWAGFSPVIAIALVSGLMLNKGTTFLLPLISLFVSDISIEILNYLNLFPFHGLYDGQILNYALLLSVAMIGWFKKNTLLTSFLGPIVFFIISNFSVWLSGGLGYASNLNGLMTCYIAGIPFLVNSIASTLIFLHSFIALSNARKNIFSI
jgi:hypothetical protein